MCDISSESTIKALKEYISIWGLPHQIVSDNGTAFASDQFREFVLRNALSIQKPYHIILHQMAWLKTLCALLKKNLKYFLRIMQDRMFYVNIYSIIARHRIVRRKRPTSRIALKQTFENTIGYY